MFREDRLYIMAAVAKVGRQPNIEVLVELESHGLVAVVMPAGMTRSRAVSAA